MQVTAELIIIIPTWFTWIHLIPDFILLFQNAMSDEAIWKKNTPFLLPKSLPRLRHLIWLHHWNKVDELMLSSNLERIEFTVWRRLMFCLRFKLLPREKKLVILRTQVWAFNDLGLKFQDWFFHHLFCRISFHLTSFTAAVPCQETAPSTSSPAQWTT